MIDIDEARAHAKEYAALLGRIQSGQSLVINALCDEIARLRAAIWEVTTIGRWTEGEQCGEWAISNEVYETARDAMGALAQQPDDPPNFREMRGIFKMQIDD